MTEHQNRETDHYPLGTDSYVPVGVDVERYRQFFNAESQRVFARQGDRLDIVRILFESGRVNASIQNELCQMTNSL
jgi:hypothetical protein